MRTVDRAKVTDEQWAGLSLKEFSEYANRIHCPFYFEEGQKKWYYIDRDRLNRAVIYTGRLEEGILPGDPTYLQAVIFLTDYKSEREALRRFQDTLEYLHEPQEPPGEPEQESPPPEEEQKAQTCECSDPDCHCCDGNCKRPSTGRLYRMDMEDPSGVAFCNECGNDAISSGVFTMRQRQ